MISKCVDVMVAKMMIEICNVNRVIVMIMRIQCFNR